MSLAPSPSSESDETPAGSGPGVLRRWTRRLSLAVLATVTVVVVTLAAALYTSVGTRLALEQGISAYSEMIPGHVQVDSIQGSLAGGTTLAGVSLRDRYGQPLIEAASVQMQLSVADALRLTVTTGTIAIDGLRVYAQDFGRGGFGDLAPDGPAEPSAPTPNFGPDLPVDLDVGVALTDARIFKGDAGRPPVDWIIIPDYTVALDASGLTAHASVRGRLSVPDQGLDVWWSEAEISWADPQARLHALLVQSSLGSLEVVDTRVDLVERAFVVHARAQPSTAVVGDGDVMVRLDGEGTALGLSAHVEVAAPGMGTVVAALDGVIEPTPQLQVLVDGGIAGRVTEGGARVPPLDLRAAIDLAGDLDVGGSLRLSTTCLGCVDELGPLRLTATALAAPGLAWGAAWAQMTAQDVLVDAVASAMPGGVAGLQSNIGIPSLKVLQPVLARFAPGLDLRGALDVGVSCAALVGLQHGACRVKVDLDKGRPVARVVADTTIETLGGTGYSLRLDELLVSARDTTIRTAGPGASARYVDDTAGLSELRLVVESATGKGSVTAWGHADLPEPARFDAHLRLDDVGLDAVNAFAPGLAMGGVLKGTVSARGTSAEPELSAQLFGRELEVRGIELGTLSVAAGYRDQRAQAELHLDSGALGSLDVDADLPVNLGLDGGEVGLRGGSRARATVDVRGVDLTAVADLTPSLRSLAGQLHAGLQLRGTLGRPRLEAEVELWQARYRDNPLPHVKVDATYERGRAKVELRADGTTAFDQLSLDATIPLRLSLRRGQVQLRPEQDHQLVFAIAGGRLSDVTRWRPEVDIGGTVDLRLAVNGAGVSPTVDAAVDAASLSYDARQIGATSAVLRYADNAATLNLHARGPAVDGIGLEARVPVTLSLDQGVRWHPTQEHHADLSINNLYVQGVTEWLPPPRIAARGRLSAELELRGTAVQPQLDASVRIRDAWYGGRKVGTATVEASYRDEVACGELTWRQSSRRSAWALVRVPLSLNLRQFDATWRKADVHQVRLSIPRLDAELLDAFVDASEFPATVALDVVGDGHLEAFELGAAIRGVVKGRTGSYPVQGRVDLNQAEQALSFAVGPSGSRWATLQATAAARIPELMRGADWKDTEIDVRVDADDLQLAILAPMLPAEIQAVSGLLNTHATVKGKAGDPQLAGDLTVLAGALTIVTARQRLEDLNLRADIDNRGINVHALSLRSGGGTVKGAGAIEVLPRRGLTGWLDLQIADVPLRSPGLPRLGITSKVATTVDMTADELAIDVKISDAQVEVETTRIAAATAIPDNPNVSYVDLSQPSIADRDATEDPTVVSNSATSLRIELVDAVKVIGPSVDMSWSGVIRTRSQGGTTASGALNAKRGFFNLLGNDFDIQEGAVTLADDGSNVPFVNLTATTTVEDMEITAKVRGGLPRPEFELSSSPSLPQSEIFAVLVTGTTDTQAADNEDVEAKAASVLAAMSNPALQRQINDRLRVDRVGLGFGDSTDQPILTVGKRITKSLYAETEYHHNAPKNENRAQLGIEYEFAPRWSLETFFGDAAAGGVAIFWSRAFGKPRPANTTKPRARE